MTPFFGEIELRWPFGCFNYREPREYSTDPSAVLVRLRSWTKRRTVRVVDFVYQPSGITLRMGDLENMTEKWKLKRRPISELFDFINRRFRTLALHVRFKDDPRPAMRALLGIKSYFHFPILSLECDRNQPFIRSSPSPQVLKEFRDFIMQLINKHEVSNFTLNDICKFLSVFVSLIILQLSKIPKTVSGGVFRHAVRENFFDKQKILDLDELTVSIRFGPQTKPFRSASEPSLCHGRTSGC